ncbi:hypothetical protein KBD09_02805 [Candidatus Woesebacteria bacterium]|nr:hypothetical protein [Candidatus Woesebacteria bacterium]
MNILTPVAIFLFLITVFIFVCVYVGRSASLYKRFFLWWLDLWGVPKDMQKNLPIEMYIKQAKNLSWLFVFLGIITASAFFLMMYYILV